MTPAELNEALDGLEAQFAGLKNEVAEDPLALRRFFFAVEAIEVRAAHGQEAIIWERVAAIMAAACLGSERYSD